MMADATADPCVHPARQRRPLRILSLCSLYPNPLQPGQGVFVQRRLCSLAALAEVRVVSPLALVQYGNPRGKRVRIGSSVCPFQRQDDGIPVLHPRWFYPPLSGSLIPFWLSGQLLYRLIRLRRSFPYDVLDTHFGFPDGIAGSLLSSALGVPFTMTLRGNEPKHSRSRMGRSLMSRALRRAGRIFAVSEKLRGFAIELGAAPDKVRTIPNGVDGDVFRRRDRIACRHKHGLAGDQRVILSAGALVERKGHHRIMEALQMLAAQGIAAQLVIAGGPGPEGQFENTLRARAAASGLKPPVRFLGALPPETLAEVMSAADVFCLASSNEGWPNVVHEALACGTPVVATDVGAVPEMLGGGRGLIVPVYAAASLKEALAAALAKNWDRDAISAWARARSWDQVASEVYAEMEILLQGKSHERSR